LPTDAARRGRAFGARSDCERDQLTLPPPAAMAAANAARSAQIVAP
jgi:hypothetical protein